jgi:hypothetical protein
MQALSPDFESIKQISPYQAEYWSARDLAPLLGYNKWERRDQACKLIIFIVRSLLPFTDKLF